MGLAPISSQSPFTSDELATLIALLAGEALGPWMPPEIPQGDIDGVNTTYTLSYVPIAYSGGLFIEGQYYNQTTDWNITSNVVTMTAPLDPTIAQDGNGNPITPNFFFHGQYLSGVVLPNVVLLEDATDLLLEDGTELLLES